MSETSRELRSAVGNIAMLLFFSFSYGFIYMRKRKKDYALNMSDSSFDFKGEYIDFLKTEGKYILAIFAVLMVIYEVARFVLPQPQNPIAAALAPVFIVGDLVDIPILRSLVAIALNISLMSLFTVLRKKKIYKEYKKEH